MTRREVIELILKHGGKVEDNASFGEADDSVWSVYFGHRADVSSIDLACLNMLSDLEWLIVKLQPGVTDSVIRRLAGLSRLEHIELDSTSISDATIDHMIGMTQRVKYLDVSDTQISDTGLDTLEKWAGLEYLDVSRTKVTAKGICRLHNLPRIATVAFHGNGIDSREIEDIRRVFGSRIVTPQEGACLSGLATLR